MYYAFFLKVMHTLHTYRAYHTIKTRLRSALFFYKPGIALPPVYKPCKIWKVF